MTQEEKAQAYDEVVARINKAVSDGLVSENFGRDMLGIAESEDERVRKDLIAFICQFAPEHLKAQYVTYLEKQKEQKPTGGSSGKPNNQWSEEDERMLRTIISDGSRGVELDTKQISWLKSLRSRPKVSDNWKPSEEQMEALKYVLGDGGVFDKDALKSLYNELHKL